MDPYVRRLASLPPLSAQSEHELAVRSWRGDRGARDELITLSLRLVVMRARLLNLHGSRLVDAVQAGTIGLIEAVDHFDPYRGCRLSTYAWWWIGHAMKQSLPAPDVALDGDPADVPGPPVEVDQGLLDGLDGELAEVLTVRFRIGAGPGRPVPRAEVARRLGLTVSQVRTREAKALSQLRRRLAKVGHRAPGEQPRVGPL